MGKLGLIVAILWGEKAGIAVLVAITVHIRAKKYGGKDYQFFIQNNSLYQKLS
jgi:hypothetical protein